jgi:hypothetical protein
MSFLQLKRKLYNPGPKPQALSMELLLGAMLHVVTQTTCGDEDTSI